MMKFKELLFLKSIKGAGKVTIFNKYLSLLDELSDLDDLIGAIEYKFGVSLEKLEMAKRQAEKLYDDITHDEEITVITLFDDEYPKKLEKMGNKRPLFLFVKGNVEALSKPNISIIGTRKPLKSSQDFEENLVKGIVNSTDKVIVSGLALGCDRIAHKATVDENKITVAVLPSGVNVITPATNKKLAENILDSGGCLVSEYLPDAKAFKSTYVERDNVVAALSDSIFVVECGIKSGTMHTVRFADSYQRRIYSYVPSQKPEGAYDGNEFILNEFSNSVKVENIEDFLSDLKNPKSRKPTGSVQKTLI